MGRFGQIKKNYNSLDFIKKKEETVLEMDFQPNFGYVLPFDDYCIEVRETEKFINPEHA